MTPVPGTHVSASVRLEACIGEGGMGSVWLARDRDTGRELAVKLVAAELVADETVRRRFAREAELGRSIASPHVVRTHAHGVLPDGTPYLVMDLCRGESLRAKLERVGRLDAAEAVGVLEQMASALEAAHALGVVHRDVKPENVFLIAPEGTVKVLDFGIAKREGAEERVLTQAGVALGTPEYMSPEQLLFPDRLESAIDVWAMAVVAYEALTGRRPFAGDTPGEIFAALCSGHAPPPSALGLPATLDALFARAFATDPAERPRAPSALARELRAACQPLLRAPARARHGAVTLATQLSPLAGTQAAGHLRYGAAPT
ncbi:MAG: serine/threonine protein kinase, partial [Myxococcales bacterium]|nr:serine/threonine protein kinase [Myxococcales bacterium]